MNLEKDYCGFIRTDIPTKKYKNKTTTDIKDIDSNIGNFIKLCVVVEETKTVHTKAGKELKIISVFDETGSYKVFYYIGNTTTMQSKILALRKNSMCYLMGNVRNGKYGTYFNLSGVENIETKENI